jgi:hypothetical protein
MSKRSKKVRKPMPPGAETRKKARKPMPPGHEALKKPRKPMPPGAEATRRERARPDVTLPDPGTGAGIMKASIGGTVLLAVATPIAAIDPHSIGLPALIIALVMFFGGMAALVWSYLVAIGRSRESEIGLAGLYGLSGSAPARVRAVLLGSAAAEVVIGLAGVAARPYSSLAFGILAVMWGIGLTGLWGARHGAFPPRVSSAHVRSRRAG